MHIGVQIYLCTWRRSLTAALRWWRALISTLTMTKTWAASTSLIPGVARSTAQVIVFMARHDWNLLWLASLLCLLQFVMFWTSFFYKVWYYMFTSICHSVWLTNLAAKLVILFDSEYSLSYVWNLPLACMSFWVMSCQNHVIFLYLVFRYLESAITCGHFASIIVKFLFFSKVVLL